MAEKLLPIPAEVIRNRRRRLLIRRGYAALGLRVCALALAGWILFSQVFLLHRVSGQGMYPAIRDGDLVLAYRLQKDYARGDVVLCRYGDIRFLGRIAGEETDVVMMDGSGSLLVNGTAQTGDILYPTYARENHVYPLRVQEGEVYVLGDYRTQTRDSRDYGPIPLDDIQGRIIAVVRRRGL